MTTDRVADHIGFDNGIEWVCDNACPVPHCDGGGDVLDRPRIGTCLLHDMGGGVREGCCHRWTEEKVAPDLEQEKVRD